MATPYILVFITSWLLKNNIHTRRVTILIYHFCRKYMMIHDDKKVASFTTYIEIAVTQ